MAKVYRNDGGAFTDIGAGLTAVQNSSVEWGDYDADGDLDILLTGSASTGPVAKVYRNDAGAFTDVGAGLTGVSFSSVAWADFDNDGDLDILLTGDPGAPLKVAKVYRNDGGVFTDVNAGLLPVWRGAVAWGDYDNDGDPDILLTGERGDFQLADPVTKIYRNESCPPSPTNSPLTPAAGGRYSGSEGSGVALSEATATDPDGDALVIAWTVSPPGVCSFDDASALNPVLTCTDNGTFTATLTVDDGTAPPVSHAASVTVANVAPTITAVTGPVAPVAIDAQPVSVAANYTDPGTADTHTCTVDYGEGSGPQPGTAANGTCTGPAHTYAAPGVYGVTVEATDDDGGSASDVFEFVVIYDPSGFVAGGGWIDSPAGAYVAPARPAQPQQGAPLRPTR